MYISESEIKVIKQALKDKDIETIEDIIERRKHKSYYKRIRKTGELTDKLKAHFESQRKLTDLQVKAIKVLYSSGRYSMRDLGAKYGVSRQTILNIVNERARYAKGG